MKVMEHCHTMGCSGVVRYDPATIKIGDHAKCEAPDAFNPDGVCLNARHLWTGQRMQLVPEGAILQG